MHATKYIKIIVLLKLYVAVRDYRYANFKLALIAIFVHVQFLRFEQYRYVCSLL